MQNTSDLLTPSRTKSPTTADLYLPLIADSDKAILLSILSTDDQGKHNLANGLFNLLPDIVAAVFDLNLSLHVSDMMNSITPVGAKMSHGMFDHLLFLVWRSSNVVVTA